MNDPKLSGYIWTYFNKTPGKGPQEIYTGSHTQSITIEDVDGKQKVQLGEKNKITTSVTDGNFVSGLPYVELEYPLAEPTLSHIATQTGNWHKTVEVPFLGTLSISKDGYILSHDEEVVVRDLDTDFLGNWAYDKHLYLVPLENGYVDVVLVLGDKMISYAFKEQNPGYHYNEALYHSIETEDKIYEYSIEHDLSDYNQLYNAPHFPLRGLLVALGRQMDYHRVIRSLKRCEMFKYLKYAKKWLQADLPKLQKQSKTELQQLMLLYFPDNLPVVLDINYRDIQTVLKAYREVKGGVGSLLMGCSRMLTMVKELFGDNWEKRYYKLVEAAKSYYSTIENAKTKLGYTFTG